MSDDLDYGQQRQMEDPSMEGTLRAQAEMIFPREQPVLEQLGFGSLTTLADLGCGTGQFAGRLAAQYPSLQITALDLFPRHIALAQELWPASEAPNVTFVEGDARATGFEDASFDAVTIRHVLHALPDASHVLGEALRILKPGGLLYVLDEDYAGLLFDAPGDPARRLFHDARPALVKHGTDLFRGRETYRDLRAAGFADVRVDPIVVDTSNTAREPFARMMRFWRDGYAEFIASSAGLEPSDVFARFDELIATIEDEDRYGCWLLFAVSGRRSPFAHAKPDQRITSE